MSKKLEIVVDEYATPIMAYAAPDMDIPSMNDLLEKEGFRHLPVLDDGKPIGMISMRDLLLIKSLNVHFDLKAKDIMTPDPYCVRKGASLEEVAFHMSEAKIGSALIVDDQGKADSIFTSVDGLNALVEITRGEI
ncbi:MAG: CBS domain-containing protein [Bacteriovoracaceae bacterium]|jgi:acetoin utilization protein AcuB|nr:CBS domain-containing protein [Bacteriovoracaceae bacterium]